MPNYIKRIRTTEGDMQIDYESLANLPDLTSINTNTLPLSGGTMTGDISFGNAANNGLQWVTNDGTRIRIRPYSPANIFQITMKPSGGDEFGALNIDTSGHVSLNEALTIANGGTGAETAATARVNLGITPANIGAEPTISSLPVSKGGTGATDAATARSNLGALTYAQYQNGYFQTGASDTSAWLTYSVSGTQKCQLDLTTDGALMVNQKTVLVNGTALPYANYSQTLTMDSWLDDNAYTLMLRVSGMDTSSIALWKSGALTVNGSIVATEGRDNTFAGTLTVSNDKSAGGYVKIWEDNEGGNIAIGSKSGKEFQIDAFDDTTLRCYAYDDNGNIKGMNFNRTNGNLSVDGDIKCANIQVGVADNVGTSGKTITFPHAFGGIPVVTANGMKQTSIRVYDITKTSCKLVSGESNNVVQWQAIYMG